MKGLWIFIIPVVGILGSCSQGNPVVDQTSVQFTQDTTAISLYINQRVFAAIKLPQGIWFNIDSTTEGIHANFSDSVKLRYTTKLMTDNSIVSQSVTPKHFVLDSLLIGVQNALPQFPAGSKGRIFIPSYYTYNPVTATASSSNLIFEFQLTEVKDHQLNLDIVTIDNYLGAHAINAVKDASGIRYTVDTLQAGAQPIISDAILVNYTAKNLSDGSIVDQRASVLGPISGSILGWQIGMQKMTEGSYFTFYLPSSLCYGATGSGKTIKPNTNLIFNVKLLKVIH